MAQQCISTIFFKAYTINITKYIYLLTSHNTHYINILSFGYWVLLLISINRLSLSHFFMVMCEFMYVTFRKLINVVNNTRSYSQLMMKIRSKRNLLLCNITSFPLSLGMTSPSQTLAQFPSVTNLKSLPLPFSLCSRVIRSPGATLM